MPKIKTHSGAKKRVSVTKTGKVKLNSANRRHDIKSTKRKRHLRKAFMAGATTAPTLKRLVPYK